jgi:hypothetical protein
LPTATAGNGPIEALDAADLAFTGRTRADAAPALVHEPVDDVVSISRRNPDADDVACDPEAGPLDRRPVQRPQPQRRPGLDQPFPGRTGRPRGRLSAAPPARRTTPCPAHGPSLLRAAKPPSSSPHNCSAPPRCRAPSTPVRTRSVAARQKGVGTTPTALSQWLAEERRGRHQGTVPAVGRAPRAPRAPRPAVVGATPTAAHRSSRRAFDRVRTGPGPSHLGPPPHRFGLFRERRRPGAAPPGPGHRGAPHRWGRARAGRYSLAGKTGTALACNTTDRRPICIRLRPIDRGEAAVYSPTRRPGREFGTAAASPFHPAAQGNTPRSKLYTQVKSPGEHRARQGRSHG